MSIMNQAARIIRAGQEYSETNQKLRKAVWDLIEWLAERVPVCDIPEELGWRITRMANNKIQVNFNLDTGGWKLVTTNEPELPMHNIHEFCRALASPEGERLIKWLENTNQERRGMLEAVALFSKMQQSLAGAQAS